MARAVLVVRTNPVPGREPDFMEWYKGYFIPEVVRLPGFVSARLMRFVRPFNPRISNDYDYLVLYEIDSEDPSATCDGLDAAERTRIRVSDALDMDPHPSGLLYEEIWAITKDEALSATVPPWEGATLDLDTVFDGWRPPERSIDNPTSQGDDRT